MHCQGDRTLDAFFLSKVSGNEAPASSSSGRTLDAFPMNTFVKRNGTLKQQA